MSGFEIRLAYLSLSRIGTSSKSAFCRLHPQGGGLTEWSQMAEIQKCLLMA